MPSKLAAFRSFALAESGSAGRVPRHAVDGSCDFQLSPAPRIPFESKFSRYLSRYRPSLVAPQHVYRQTPRGLAVYLEACKLDIYRVGLQLQKIAPFVDEMLTVPEADRRRFDYMVQGDADTEAGLIASYDEEEAKAQLHIETCREQTHFDFWRANPNGEQVVGRLPELPAFSDGEGAGARSP